MSLTIIRGDIRNIRNVDVIVNAANARGIMGAGIAKVIADTIHDPKILNGIRQNCASRHYCAGDIYESKPGGWDKHGVKTICHAVTMENPGGVCSLDTIETCLSNIYSKYKHDSICIPGLGGGIGRLSYDKLAQLMIDMYLWNDHYPAVCLIDTNTEYIDRLMYHANREVLYVGYVT